MTKWIKQADRINRTMQSAAGLMTKESQVTNPSVNYGLNSYALHCKQLINTIHAFLPPGFDKNKIDSIFVENTKDEKTVTLLHDMFTVPNQNEGTIRKRVLNSSTFATAYKVRNILTVFKDLRYCKTNAPELFR